MAKKVSPFSKIEVVKIYSVFTLEIEGYRVRLEVNEKDDTDAKLISIDHKINTNSKLSSSLFEKALEVYQKTEDKRTLRTVCQ